jgi:hypothetical protein
MDYSEHCQLILMQKIQSENFGKVADVSMEIQIIPFHGKDLA